MPGLGASPAADSATQHGQDAGCAVVDASDRPDATADLCFTHCCLAVLALPSAEAHGRSCALPDSTVPLPTSVGALGDHPPPRPIA